MVIDTKQPVIRSLQARRQGTEVFVSWELQEDNPDGGSFRLEYQAKDGGLWTAIPANAGPSGETRFQPSSGQPLQIRLTMRDLAGNQSFKLTEVPGDIATASFNPNPGAGGATQAGGPTSPMPSNPLDLGPPIQPPNAGLGGPPPPIVPAHIDPVMPPPITPPSSVRPMLNPQPVAPDSPRNPTIPAAIGPGSIGQPALQENEPKVIASSRWTPTPPAPVIGTMPPPAPSPEIKPPPAQTRPLPPLQYINQPEFMVEYEVSKIGPSGIGSVELYRTRDDGHTWEKYAYDAAVGAGTVKGTRLQRLVQFYEGEPDGIYGFTLLVKNRANIGRRPPQPDEAPELRIELDQTPPMAELYAPTPNPQHGNLVLHWKAADKNLTKAPIMLEWAEKRAGPWQPIGLDLPNTGHYVWKLPEQMPVEVYLRLRVRDLANNETVAITPNPLPVDLNEPEGHLMKISLPNRLP